MTRGKRGALVLVVVACPAALFAAGCGAGEYKAPSSFTANEQSIDALVTSSINGTEGSAKLSGEPNGRCPSNECTIRYTVKEPAGIDFDIEMIDPTRQIWKALFEDPKVEGAEIIVEGPTVTQGGIKEISPLFSMTCTRQDAQQIDWDNVEASGLKKICKYNKEVQ